MKEFYIYHDYIPKVGGIETVVFNLAKALDKDGVNVTIIYNSAESPDTIFKYAQVANVIKDTKDLDIKCDVLLLASNHNPPKGVEANRYLQWVHSDYDKYKLSLKNIGLHDNGRLTYIAVSEHAKNVIKRRENVNCEVIYNFVDVDFGIDTRRVLRLVTNTRVSPEKGLARMLDFAKQLKENNIRFSWIVYGDNTNSPDVYEETIKRFKHIEEVQFVGFKNEIEIGLTNADYLVQLSDFEGCPLSVLEALKMNVPCIVTDWIGVKEIITDGETGYILEMKPERLDRLRPLNKNIDFDKIVNKIPKVEYKPLSSVEEWKKIIG